MASPATSSHLPALAEPHERAAIAHELQSTMQELVDLSLIGKQLHWAVVGHAFRPVHEQLDELVASWRDLADVVAERAVALGYVPDGQARAVAAGSPLSPVAAEAIESHAVVRAITDRIALRLSLPPRLVEAVRANEAALAGATLATSVDFVDGLATTSTIDGDEVGIELEVV